MFTLPFTMTVGTVAQVEEIGTNGPFFNTDASNIAMTLPGGTQEGDLIIVTASCSADSSGGSVDGPTTSGWTLMVSGGFSLLRDVSIYYKFAGPSEANFSMQFSPGTFSEACTCALVVFRNADAPTLEDQNIGTGSSIAATSYNEPDDGSWELIYGAAENLTTAVDITTVTPAGYTSLVADTDIGLGASASIMSYRKNSGIASVNYSAALGASMDYAWRRINIPRVTPASPGAPLTYISSGASSVASGGGFNVNMPVTPQAGDIIVVVAASADAGGSQDGVATISGDTTYTTVTNNVVVNNARSVLSVHYAVAAGTESSINVSWSQNALDFRAAVILIYRPTGTVVYDSQPAISVTTSGSSQSTGAFTDFEGQSILAWFGNATSTNTLNVSTGPTNGTQRQIIDGSSFSQQDKELAVYELVHADRGSITRSLTWNGSITEGLCGGVGITDT